MQKNEAFMEGLAKMRACWPKDTGKILGSQPPCARRDNFEEGVLTSCFIVILAGAVFAVLKIIQILK